MSASSESAGGAAVPVTRIAMWSGPRNISTAMMRAWENRIDTFVTDEPFYAYYLATTGIDHPMREEVLLTQPNDWKQVAIDCTTMTEGECSVHFQKHMTQHMLPQIDLGWLDAMVNIFLIRSPAEVVSSYAKARSQLTVADVGFEQQFRLYQHVTTHLDSNPLVVDAGDVLKNPQMSLSAICRKAGIEFDPAMLKWPAGRRTSDGVWASHWYRNVENSTQFAAQQEREITLDADQQKIADLCQPHYEAMQLQCIKCR